MFGAIFFPVNWNEFSCKISSSALLRYCVGMGDSPSPFSIRMHCILFLSPPPEVYLCIDLLRPLKQGSVIRYSRSNENDEVRRVFKI